MDGGMGGLTAGQGAHLPPTAPYLPTDSQAYACDVLGGSGGPQTRVPDLNSSQTRVADQLGKSFSMSHLLELQGAGGNLSGNLYHSHHHHQQLLEHHRINSHMKIPEGFPLKYIHQNTINQFDISLIS